MGGTKAAPKGVTKRIPRTRIEPLGPGVNRYHYAGGGHTDISVNNEPNGPFLNRQTPTKVQYSEMVAQHGWPT